MGSRYTYRPLDRPDPSKQGLFWHRVTRGVELMAGVAAARHALEEQLSTTADAGSAWHRSNAADRSVDTAFHA